MEPQKKKFVVLKKNEERRLLAGHQWIFSNEVGSLTGDPISGDIVEIHRHDHKFLGIGFYNPHSLIAVRFLSPEREEIDFHFFKKRIDAAYSLRKKLFPHSAVYRLVHSESDFLPGLIVDKYNEYLSIQIFSAGMEKRSTLICDVLESIFSPRGIVERNESTLRSLEQLELRKGVMRGTVEPTIIDLEGIQFRVDVLEGQKTGFFLDQRLNRTTLRPFAKDKSVLDCFCNEGGFALYAASGGASEVLASDGSESALERAASNAELNKLKNVTFQKSDAFELLSSFVQQQKKFDIVVLDPPSFTKSKKTIATAVKGYKELNTAALKILSPGGILATASCSHHIPEETFFNLIGDSGVKSGRSLRMISFSGASPDHPILVSMPETKYLKFALFYVE
jgi:23S rRNA (cytosine1962-C5)-methyltransferase